MTQTALAHRLGMSQNTVSKWETGQSSPSGEHLIGLLGALDIDPDDYAAARHGDAAAAALERIARTLERIATRLLPAALLLLLAAAVLLATLDVDPI